MKKYAMLCLSLVFINIFKAEAKYNNNLSLKQAFEIAERNSIKLKSIKEKFLINSAQKKTESTWSNPYLLSDNGISENTYRLGLQKTFEVNNKSKIKISQVELNRNLLNAEQKKESLNLFKDVKFSYMNLNILNIKLDKLKNLLEINTEIVNDSIENEIKILNIKTEIKSTSIEISKAKHKLSTLLNQPLENNLILEKENLKSPIASDYSEENNKKQIEKLSNIAFKNRFELVENTFNLKLAELNENLARLSIIPDITLASGGSFVTNPNNLGLFLMGTIEIPIFNRQDGAIEESIAIQKQLKLEEESIKTIIKSEITESYMDLLINDLKLKNYEKELLPRFKKIITNSKNKTEELNSKQEFISKELEYVELLFEQNKLISLLESLTGYSYVYTNLDIIE